MHALYTHTHTSIFMCVCIWALIFGRFACIKLKFAYDITGKLA